MPLTRGCSSRGRVGKSGPGRGRDREPAQRVGSRNARHPHSRDVPANPGGTRAADSAQPRSEARHQAQRCARRVLASAGAGTVPASSWSREIPNAQAEAALSTTEAVQLALRRGGDGASISTARAAALYGGEVIAAGISNSTNNVTRFVVLGRGTPPPTGRDRTSIAFTFAEDAPGSLSGVLNAFADAGINCSRIESRPTRATFGEYVFLIDFEGHVQDELGIDLQGHSAEMCGVEGIRKLSALPRLMEAGTACEKSSGARRSDCYAG